MVGLLLLLLLLGEGAGAAKAAAAAAGHGGAGGHGGQRTLSGGRLGGRGSRGGREGGRALGDGRNHLLVVKFKLVCGGGTRKGKAVQGERGARMRRRAATRDAARKQAAGKSLGDLDTLRREYRKIS